MRKLIAGTVGAAIALTGLVGLAGPASAETGSSGVITQSTTGYSGPSKTSPAILTGLDKGQQVDALCFTDKGDELNGSKYWFKIRKAETPDGYAAFVHRDVTAGITGLPNCWPNG